MGVQLVIVNFNCTCEKATAILETDLVFLILIRQSVVEQACELLAILYDGSYTIGQTVLIKTPTVLAMMIIDFLHVTADIRD